MDSQTVQPYQLPFHSPPTYTVGCRVILWAECCALRGLPGLAPWLSKLGRSSKSSLWYPEGAGALLPVYTLQHTSWQCPPACLSVLGLVCTISPGVWSSGFNPHTQGASQTSKKYKDGMGERERGECRSLSQQSPPVPSPGPGNFWCHFSPVLNPSAPRTGQEEGNASSRTPAPSSSLLPGSIFEAQ